MKKRSLLVIFAMVLSVMLVFNLFGDQVRDLLDPKNEK